MRPLSIALTSLTVAALAAPTLAGTVGRPLGPHESIVPASKCGTPPPGGGNWQCVASRVQVGRGSEARLRVNFTFRQIRTTYSSGGTVHSDSWSAAP
jgi:hypothetical protein